MLKPLAIAPFLIAAISCFSGCHTREAAESQFLGTWHADVPCIDCTIDYTFLPDHTVIWSGDGMEGYIAATRAKWFLDYKRILFRWKDDDGDHLSVMNIKDVTPDKITVALGEVSFTLTRSKTLTPEYIEGLYRAHIAETK